MQTHADVKHSPGLDTPDQHGVPEIGPFVENLDVATVLKVSQAVSGEIELGKLVEVILRTAIEQAGAERALLILPRGSELWIQAEAKTHGNFVTVRLNEAPVSVTELPESIVRYVARTQEIVILDDASARNPFSADEYIRKQRLRSVLCLPLAKQSTLIALLYLENNIGPNIFAPAKINVMRVLASAAAISLDNSHLYRELQEREGMIRRLVNANIIGIVISDSEGQIIKSNDAFLKMVGYTREELVSGRMNWRNMTPAEWKEVSEQGVVQVNASGACKAFEKEYCRKDGGRVPVLVGAARFEKNSIVAFAIDLSERKRAEEALQLISRDLQESKAKLEEAQRITHVGYWERDIATGRVTWSDETYRIFGLQPQERPMDLNAIMQMIHPEDREFVSRTQKEALVAGPHYDFEYRLLRPTGELRIVHAEGYIKKDESGRPYQAFGTVQDITNRKHAEEALKQSEFYLAEGQRLAHAGSWSFKPDLTCDYWSRELYEVLGFDPRNGIPTISDYFTRVHPQDRAVVESTIQRMIAAGEGCDLKKRIIRPDGVQRIIRCVGMPVREKGVVTRFVGTLMDITEQEELIQELRRTKAHLTNAQRLSHTGSVGMEVKTASIYWSEESARIYGYPPGTQPTPELILQRVHPDDVALLKSVLERAAQGGHDFEFEHRLLMPDGSIKHIYNLSQCVRDEAGNEEIVGAITDFTERKLAEEAIRRNETYLAEAQKLSQTGSFAWSPEGIRFWSEECYRVQGFDPQDGLPRFEELFQRVHPDDQPKWIELMQKIVPQKLEFETDYRLVLPDGSVRDIHCIGHPVLGPSGDLIEYIGTVIDNTDRKRAEALLMGEKRLHEMIATGVPLKETLNALCRMIEDQRGSTLASVLLLCPDGIHLESFAGPSLPEGWTQQIASLPIGPCAGSCGTAAYRGSPVIVSDIATDPLWAVANHRASALSYGLRASWSYPILSSGGKVLGTVCLYYREPRSPSPSDLNLIELATHLARVAIECKVAEEQLRRSEALLAEGQRLSHTGSWVWKPATGEMTSSKERFRIFGLDPDKTKPSFEVFLKRVHPEDREKLKQTFDSATREKRDFENECRIVTPDWVIKHVHTVGHAILNESDELVEFIGATMDITGRKRAEERAQSYNEAIRLALNAFVEELDVDRFLGHVMTGLTKQFQATSCELWLFDDPIGAKPLHLVYQQGRMIRAKTVGLKTAKQHTAWQPSNIGRIPRIIEVSDQASLLQPTHLKLLKEHGIKMLMAVPLVLGEQNLGVVELRFQEATKFTQDDLNLAQALVHHATLALQLSRLAHRTEQMAVTQERNRMAREIHDTLAQAFAGVVLHSEALGTALGVNKSRSKKALSNIQKLARSGLEEARRSVQALRPRALESRTLSQALAQEAKRLSEDGRHSCEFKQKGDVLKLSAEIQNEFFRIAQEAMTNISKHAQAKSVWITLEFKDNQVTLTVQDDGIGFAASDSLKPKGGYGLSTMRERALRIGGKLEIESPDSGGTVIRVVASLDKKLQQSNHST